MTQYVRTMRFVLVGAVCYLAQLLLFEALLCTPMHLFVIGWIAFAASAQLNFVASTHFTWSDHKVETRMHRVKRWFSFNGMVAIGGVLNAALALVFATTTWHWLAIAMATIVTSGITFVVNHYLVFGRTHEWQEGAA